MLIELAIFQAGPDPLFVHVVYMIIVIGLDIYFNNLSVIRTLFFGWLLSAYCICTYFFYIYIYIHVRNIWWLEYHKYFV